MTVPSDRFKIQDNKRNTKHQNIKINTKEVVFDTKAFGTIYESVYRIERHPAGPSYQWQAKSPKST